MSLLISGELEIVLLIFGLYGSTCVAFVYANEGIVQRVFRGIQLRVPDDWVRIAGRSPMWLNPFTPMFPAFRGSWGNPDTIAASPGLPSRTAEGLRACEVLAPYVFAVFIYTVIGIPVALLLGSAAFALPIVALAYLAAVILMVRLWFLRDCFSLSKKKFALLMFESMACLPFSAGIVRRLSLMTPLSEDLASHLADMPSGSSQRAAASLAHRCEEMAGFYADESRDHIRLLRYRRQLSPFVAAHAAPETAACATRSNEADGVSRDDGRPTVRS